MSNTVEHIDINALSRLIGTPQRAIKRWVRQAGGIPHTGTGHQLMFPKQAALEWVKEKHRGLYFRIVARGGEA